jgi:hypothetical protein
VHLDPDVKVVPVVTFVAWGDGRPGPPAYSDYPALGPHRVLYEDTRAFFDDEWLGHKHPSSSPGYSPEQVVGWWEVKAGCNDGSLCASRFTAAVSIDGTQVTGGRYYPPDRLFDQCNVQFREVAHHKCRMPPDVLHPSSDPCPGTVVAESAAKKVRDYVNDHCMERDSEGNIVPEYANALIVVFMGHFTNEIGCAERILGANIPGSRWVFVTPHAYTGVISHEIGHALGLGHVCPNPDNLMCAKVSQNLTGLHGLTATQCTTALANATTIHNGYW